MEKINIAELLTDCPTGMELDCTEYDGFVKFDGFNKNNPYTIRIIVFHDGCVNIHNLTEYGQTSISSYNKCVIFPKGKTTWEGFHRPFKDGDILVGKANQPFIFQSFNRSNGCISYCGIDTCELFHLYSDDWTFANSLRFATEEEKEKLFQSIKDNGYKWNAETKTLEKLVNMEDAEFLQPYKEAPMYLNAKANKKVEEIAKILESAKKIMEEIKLDIPDGYEFFGIDDDKIVLTKKQPQYPKTYEECCMVLDIQSDWHLTFELNNPASCDLCVKNEFEYVCKLEAFRKLLICRDAYWKIAGDWKEKRKEKAIHYVICSTLLGELVKDTMPNCIANYLLDFPTAEMQDAFLENFKELIELCKELL